MRDFALVADFQLLQQLKEGFRVSSLATYSLTAKTQFHHKGIKIKEKSTPMSGIAALCLGTEELWFPTSVKV